MLKENHVNVVRYADISGARYSRLEGMIITALKEAQENSVVAVIAGSNDCRDLAQNLTPSHDITFNDTAMSILGMDISSNPDGHNTTASRHMILKSLKNILKAATQSRATVIVSSPLPSPCYGNSSDKKHPNYNKWCNLSPCEHEKLYYQKLRSLKAKIQAYCHTASKRNIVMLDVTTPFLLQPTRTSHDPIVDRNHFRKNNVHFNKAAALKLSQLCLESIMAQFH